MSIWSYLKALVEVSGCFVHQPGLSARLLRQLPRSLRAFNYAQDWTSSLEGHTRLPSAADSAVTGASPNPLRAFFDARETGRGIWKWTHYFDIYHRHFSKFIGRDVHVLEIGVYSGGSLEMWRDYFGPRSRIYGVDIEAACKAYENDYTQVFIGDQADRKFWQALKDRVPPIDILIDDGGHQPEQQIVTLEEMLPHIRPGGVYLCEDIHTVHSGFAAYLQGLVCSLNAYSDTGSQLGISASEFQAWISSVHHYPYVTVVEKADSPVRQLTGLKHGTEWQPFFSS
jgi:methyltransferase family protein